MSNVYFISDLHLGHINMAKHRGFDTIEQHDELIIKNWNKTVNKKDTVYVLGDITMEKNTYTILRRFNGSINVILGNHDLPQHTQALCYYVNKIAGCLDYKGFHCSHVPIHPFEIINKAGKHFFIGNIHGHVHENSVIRHDGSLDKRYYNVSAEAVNYTPVAFDVIKKYFQLQ